MGKKEEKMKTEFIEIKDGDLYLKVPKGVDYEKIARVLLIFNNPTPKVEPAVVEEKPKEEQIEVTAEPQLDEFMTRCPKCNSKVKSKVRKSGSELVRVVRCKKSKGLRKKCDFVHEFTIKV
jgi:hypothetical protein